MSNEGPNFEHSESYIDQQIEDLAAREEMDPSDIFSDIRTFAEICEGDENAAAYLEMVAEKIKISFEEMLAYARKLKER